MNSPLITIAMPFYNNASTLELAVRSLLNQSCGDFELLLCDDGSSDQGLAIARTFDDPRVICWSDGKRMRLAPRLNECIDRARGEYFARMDADDIAYPLRLATQLAFLRQHPEIDLCGGGAMVFGRYGRPLWRFSPATGHAHIVRAPFRGFPLWHPVWMGRTAWFRHWRYDEGARLAQDQELLLRSFRDSRFANLPWVLLGYRREGVTLKKLVHYKLLHIRYTLSQPHYRLRSWQKAQLVAVSGARVAANCFAALSKRRIGHQAALAPTAAELAEWQALWTHLSSWCGRPVNEGLCPCLSPSALASAAGELLRIVHVLTRGDVLGGAQSHVRELALALRSFGHDVTVITGAPGVFTCQLQQAGICWISVPSLVRPLRPHLDLAALIELCVVLGRLKPDLVCAHTAKAGVVARAAARLRGIPSVFTPHGWSIFHRGSLQPIPFYCFAERLASRLGTRVISVCEYERRLAERFAVCPAAALDVVPNGIAELSLPRLRPVEAQPPVMVMVARFAPQKDHGTLLRALAGLLHREWRLQLVGDGASKRILAAQVEELGFSSRVSMLPPETDVNRLLMEAQIFVLSTNFEAFPISILEAMRAGLPVVATDVGGVGESVRHEETGLLVGHRSEQDLRDALERMITQPAWRASLGEAGQRLWARQFTATAMATRTVESTTERWKDFGMSRGCRRSVENLPWLQRKPTQANRRLE